MKSGQDTDSLSSEIGTELRALLGPGLRHRPIGLATRRLEEAAQGLSRHPDRPMESKLKDLLENAAKPMSEARREAVAALLDFGPKAGAATLKGRRQAAAVANGRSSGDYFRKRQETPLLRELTECIVRLVVNHDPSESVATLGPAEQPDHQGERSQSASFDIRRRAKSALQLRRHSRQTIREYITPLAATAMTVGKQVLGVYAVTVMIVGCVLLLKGPRAETETHDWGPPRETFTWAHRPNHGMVDSATNNPTLGNETRFLFVEGPTKATEAIVHPEERITLRAAFDNDAYVGNVEDAHIHFEIPGGAGKTHTITAAISYRKRGHETETVWSNAYVYSIHPFYVMPVSETERLWTHESPHGKPSRHPDRDDSLKCGSVVVGVILPGCVGYLEIEVMIEAAPDG